VVSFTIQLLYFRRNIWVSNDGRLCGPQSWSGPYGKDKKIPSLPLLGIKPQLVVHMLPMMPQKICNNDFLEPKNILKISMGLKFAVYKNDK
jgi:hypothetical protein